MSTTSELLAENMRLRLAITGDGDSRPPTTSDCVVMAERARERSERRRHKLREVGTLLCHILPLLQEGPRSDLTDRAIDQADAALGLSIPDHGLLITTAEASAGREPVAAPKFDALMMAAVCESAAPGEVLSPGQLVTRTDALRRHSETLNMVDAILRGEPLNPVTPMDADLSQDVLDGLVDRVTGMMDALRCCADALAALRGKS